MDQTTWEADFENTKKSMEKKASVNLFSLLQGAHGGFLLVRGANVADDVSNDMAEGHVALIFGIFRGPMDLFPRDMWHHS